MQVCFLTGGLISHMPLSVDRKKEEQRLSPLIHLRWQINVEGKPAKGDGRKAISEAERKLGEWGVLEAK